MNWYSGTIAEAVAQSKVKNAIFVVYVEGNDETSAKITRFIDDERVRKQLEGDKFVAIKIGSDSQAYVQFATIYQIVPVPSIFFIGKSGTPLEIGTGVISNVEEILQKINKVLVTDGSSSAASSLIQAEQANAVAGSTRLQTTTISTESDQNKLAEGASNVPLESQAAGSQKLADNTGKTELKTSHKQDEIVCEGDICYKKSKGNFKAEESKSEPDLITQKDAEPKLPTTEADQQQQQPSPSTSQDAEGHMAEARKLLENKRRERIEEENRLEKEQELRRRKEGKELQHMQSWQREQELKDLKENIRRERLAEQEARERIRAQIAGDRAERAQKLAIEAEGKTDKTSVVSPAVKPINVTDQARLQFRLPGGNQYTQAFNCQESLSTVRTYVKDNLLAGTGVHEFTLATNYPKREFSVEDDVKTLVDLSLFPNAVVMVISKDRLSSNPIVRSGGLVNLLTTAFWALLTPFFATFDYVRKWSQGRVESGAQKRSSDDTQLAALQAEAAKRRNLERYNVGGVPQANAVPTSNAGLNNEPLEPQQPMSRAYRRYGESNVHRLRDTTKDSDDENATWNGNSTQQQ